MIQIDKNVRLVGLQNSKYPWREMSVGDSFFIPNKTVQHGSALAQQAKKRLGSRFTCRTVDGGVRIWRIA